MEPDPKRLSVVFIGRRTLLSASVLEAVAKTHNVVAVVESQPEGYVPKSGPLARLRPSQRRLDLQAFAKRRKIPYLLLWRSRMDQLQQLVARVKPDLGVIAVMASLMPEPIAAMFPLGMLNVHPTMLPKYRGPNPLFWEYYFEEQSTGVTIHYLDGGEDTGDIVLQRPLSIPHGEHGRTLDKRQSTLAAEMIPGVLDDIAAGRVTRTVQRDQRCPYRGRMLAKGENPIDWAAWPISRTYHVLCGADGWLDLVPPRQFPWTMFDWSPAGSSESGARDGAPVFERRGTEFFITTPTGRVKMKPKWSFNQAKRGLRRTIK